MGAQSRLINRMTSLKARVPQDPHEVSCRLNVARIQDMKRPPFPFLSDRSPLFHCHILPCVSMNGPTHRVEGCSGKHSPDCDH